MCPVVVDPAYFDGVLWIEVVNRGEAEGAGRNENRNVDAFHAHSLDINVGRTLHVRLREKRLVGHSVTALSLDERRGGRHCFARNLICVCRGAEVTLGIFDDSCSRSIGLGESLPQVVGLFQMQITVDDPKSVLHVCLHCQPLN